MPISAEKVRELAARGERTNLDYKLTDYDWDVGGNLELTKDVMAMANALGPTSEPAYILLGVEEHTGRIAGIGVHLDDAALHQKVGAYLNRTPNFIYGAVEIDGLSVGVYEIRPGGRPFFALRDFTARNRTGRDVTMLHKHVALMRVGSSTERASPTEVIEWSKEDDQVTHELNRHALVKARAEAAVEGNATIVTMSSSAGGVEVTFAVENTGRSGYAIESISWEAEWLPRFFAGETNPEASGFLGTALPEGYRPPSGELGPIPGLLPPGDKRPYLFKWTRTEAVNHLRESGLKVNGFAGNWAAYHFVIKCRSDLNGTGELRCTAKQ